jgi:uncharacterized protein (TIGR02996 family)
MRDELLAAVLANPDADEPRLVYADWLTANGDPRGELITVQVELARLTPDDDAYPALLRRSDELVAKARPPRHWSYRRGFVDKAEISRKEDFARGLEALLRAEPVTTIVDAREDAPALRAIRFLRSPEASVLRSPHVTHLRELVLTDPRTTPDDLGAILRMRELTHLTVPEALIDQATYDELVRLPSLRSIGSGEVFLPPEDVLPRLEKLETMVPIAAALPHLQNLTELACALIDEDVHAMADWPGLARLRRLEIAMLDDEPGLLIRIVDSPHLARGTLRTLMIQTWDLDRSEVRELGNHPALAGVHHLIIDGGAPEGIDGFPRLVSLDISGPLEPEGARRLLEHPRLARVRYADESIPREAEEVLRTRFPYVD